MVKIVVLNDDRCNVDNLKHVHGLSLYVNVDNYELLFDLGQEDCFKSNSQKLGINLDNIKCIVLSHGHYDHTDGLVYANKKIDIICHPDCTIWRQSKRTEKYNGIPYNEEELKEKFNLIMSKTPYKISKKITFLGEIERIKDFECKEFPSILEDKTDDIAIDDTGIVIDTEKGLIVISGCSHSGICNTIEYAKKVTGKNDIYAVMGGFHLKKCNDQTQKTIEFMKEINVKKLFLGHCTSDEVCQKFIDELSDNIEVQILETGKEYIFEI